MLLNTDSVVSNAIVELAQSDLAVVSLFKLGAEVVCDVVWPNFVVPCWF